MQIYYEDHKSKIKIWRRNNMECRPHFHNSIELLYVMSGKCTAYVDFKEYTVEAGDVLISFPIQIHSYKDDGPLDSYLMIFPDTMCPAFSQVMHQNIPDCPLIKGEKLNKELIYTLAKRLNDTNAHALTKFKYATLEGYFTAFIGELLEKMPLRGESRNYSTEHRIIAYCTENYKDELTLDSVAAALHISKYHISHLFSDKLQTGFCNFVNSLRLSEACRMLKKGEGTTKAALSSGFPSVRTFNRIFRAEFNMSPTDYMNLYKTNQ